MKQRMLWLAGAAGFMAACRWVPGWAALWCRVVSQPLLSAMHRAAARLPFPLLEPLALALLLAGLRHGVSGLMRSAGAVLTLYVLLWYPAYWRDPKPVPTPADAPALEALCGRMAEALTDGGDVSPASDRTPGDVAGLPDATVKRARYPEWMRALGIAGLFSPWTGEVILDDGQPPALLPFTGVHELMHLEGVADEGAANIAAYAACMRAGGGYAASARLWALRYALERLRALDAEACERAAARLPAPLSDLCLPDAPPHRAHPLMRLIGLEMPTTDYAVLADWMVAAQTP